MEHAEKGQVNFVDYNFSRTTTQEDPRAMSLAFALSSRSLLETEKIFALKGVEEMIKAEQMRD